jgi:biotin transport system substrate-specific component
MKNITTRQLVLASLFAALTAALSYVSIPLPFSPVPITGQTFGVMLSGALLGSKLSALSQVVYLILGAIGLPVFANGASGIGTLFGASGGFLFGFPIGAYITGLMLEKKQSASIFYISIAIATGGILAVYLPGIAQLGRFVEGGITGAFMMMLLYIPGDIIKVIVCTGILKAFKTKGVLSFMKSSVNT